jgi:hypothetical protein
MAGKKAHKPRDPGDVGNHGIHPHPGHARKSTGQTEGQFAMDRPGRKGQYSGAGSAPLIRK